MDRQKIQNIVIGHLVANVDGVAPGDVDPSKSMADYDASSLDIVEIVHGIMRELKISVPRTEFAEIRSIDQLIDLFCKAANGTA